MALILLTNDDGIEAEGLRTLERSLADIADLVIVAPDQEQSAVSHSITVRSPLEARQLDTNHYTVSGTPADCVIYSLANVLTLRPDLVISGINHGANLGDDIMYSGTVAGAREASRRGLASLAISQAYDDRPVRFHRGAKFARLLVKALLAHKADGGLCLNVNIPVGRIRGVKITRQGCSLHYPHFNSLDRNGADTGGLLEFADDPEKSALPQDYKVVWEHYVSVTPLQRDQTDYALAERFAKDPPRLFRRLRVPGIGLIP